MSVHKYSITHAIKVIGSIKDAHDLMTFKTALKSQEDMMDMREMVKKFDEGCILGARVRYWAHRDSKEVEGTIIAIVGKSKFRIQHMDGYHEAHHRFVYGPAKD